MAKYNTESWEDVKGYPNYKVSNLGRIYSKRSDKLLSIQIRKDGYNVVSLWREGKGKAHYLHRLVLTHFSDDEIKDTVNHIDGDKSNNCISNLEWMSYKENNLHAIEMGLNATIHRRNCKGSIKVEQWSLEGELIKVYPSMREAERITGIDATSIGHGIRKGWNYGGFKWKAHQ